MFAATATAPEETRTLALDRHAPEWLQDATKFKTHAHIFNPVWVIRTLRRYEGPPHRLLDPLLRVRVGGCWYAVLDATAGVRAYVRGNKVKRFWVGFYNAKAIDHFIGAPVAVRVTSASTQEYYTYPELLDAATKNTGVLPRAVVGDRGYSVSPAFEHNTRLGVASVFPWRASNVRPEREMEDCDTHDRHGVVRCKHCGSPTRFISFTRTAGGNRGPRLYVQCLQPITAGCETRQSIGCNVSWRMLVPLWRDTPTYLALRHSHHRYERVHHHWRVRWRSGADDHALRPKRRGRDNQQLRANAALLIEWLMVCWREEWLPDSRPRGVPHRDRIIEDDGTGYASSLANLRHELGLDRPFGTKAVALGIGPAVPLALSPDAVADDPAEPEEPPVVPPELPGETEDHREDQPGKDAAEVDVDDLDDMPF